MSGTLTGTVLAAAVDLATAVQDGHEIAFYLSNLPRGELDEAAIVAGWLPGAGWTDVTGEILLSAGAEVAHDGVGHTITFTVADESRTRYADDLAIAVIARHWFPSAAAWGGYHLIAWGYLDGSDRQRLGQGLDQTGQRTATYAGYWGKARVPAVRLGRRNLATSATVAASSPALATPAAESPVEYVSQDDCAAQKLIDGNADTVAVADVIADPAQPAIGDTSWPRFLRVYGPQQRGVAVGGEPRFVEVWFGHNATSWGGFDSPGAVPSLGPDSGNNVRNDGQVISSIVGSKYVVRALAQGSTTTNGVQWNLAIGQYGIPVKVVFRVKAGSTASIGRSMMFSWQIYQGSRTDTAIVLTDTFTEWSFDIDLAATSDLLVLAFQSGRGEVLSQDLYFEIDSLAVWQGYDDLHHATLNGYQKLFLCWDNGAGVERNQRVAFGLIPGEQWTIPPLGSVVFCDDIPTFKAKFGDTGKTLFQMKADNAAWFFAPGVGRLKLAYGTNPSLTDYDDPGLVTAGAGAEIDFAAANGGVPWLPTQALSRNAAPVGTSTMTVEDFPHLGLLPGAYGAAYWWLDLGAYTALKLTMPVPAGATTLPVDNIDAYTAQGFATVMPANGRVWWIGKTEDSLILHDPLQAAHAAGDAVIPDGWGGSLQNNGTKQTGWNIDTIEIRRKPGTPLILAGAVLTSNQLGPGNPSTGGAKWENHPDWRLVQRFADRQGNPDVITMTLPEGIREARHVLVVVDRMDRYRGQPQRAKINEVVIREAALAGSQGGGWSGRNAGDLGGVLGYLLRAYGDMPASKVALATGADGYTPIGTPPIGDLPIAPTSLQQAVQTVAASGLLAVRLDSANVATIDADPASPAYTATAPVWTLTLDNLLGDVSLTWTTAHQVAQVKVTARETASLRTYAVAYPRRPARLGSVTEIRDVTVRSAFDVYPLAEAAYRKGNARRQLSATTGALPFLQAGQRFLLDLGEIDAGGNAIGVNFVIANYAIKLGVDDGGVSWDCSISLNELPL